jgi:pimeloyl-ACP methyl ester carboxylesterase
MNTSILLENDLESKAGAALTRRYVGPTGRQIHLIEAGEEGAGRVICLHATAYSARSFEPFLQAMGRTRHAIAMDTPGYGASDRPNTLPDIAAYAAAIAEAVGDLGDGPSHIFGYHTGALIAAELARQRPDLIRRVILIGVPLFSGQEQLEWKRRLAARTTLGDRLDQFSERWDYLVARRPPGIDLVTGFGNFVDELRAYPDGWWAHDAAFSFDGEVCMRSVKQPTLVLNPDTPLSDAARRAAALLPAALLVELPHLGRSILETGAEELAARIEDFVSES